MDQLIIDMVRIEGLSTISPALMIVQYLDS